MSGVRHNVTHLLLELDYAVEGLLVHFFFSFLTGYIYCCFWPMELKACKQPGSESEILLSKKNLWWCVN
jgi:hypothetical protein